MEILQLMCANLRRFANLNDYWQGTEEDHVEADKLMADLALWLASQPPLSKDDQALLEGSINAYRAAITGKYWYS